MCRHVSSQQTFVSGLDHCPCTHHYSVGSHKHQAYSSRTPPRDIDLQWCLVEDSIIVVIFRPSHVHLLDGASVSRPHHCQPQWVASNQSVGGRLGNHNAAPHCCKESDWANSLRLCRLVLFLVTLVQYSQDLVTATFVGSFSYLFSLPSALMASDILGIMSKNSSSFHCMQHIPVRLPIASISTYSTFRSPSMSDIHLLVEHTRLTESQSAYKIELDLSALFSNF